MNSRIIQEKLIPGFEGKRYWLTPPEILKELDSEFHFNYDPCPFPRPIGFDGLEAEWGTSNYINPPFKREDGSATAFARKAIEEQKKGRTSVVIIPCTAMIQELLSAGAEFRVPPGGSRVGWLDCETKEPMPNPGNYAIFILRGNKEGE